MNKSVKERIVSALKYYRDCWEALASLDSLYLQGKVEAMNPRELEDLAMAVMKRELSAVINLGALIGLVLGIFNLFI